MYKILAVAVVVLFVSGCANFKVTGTMCDSINQEPGGTVPEECQAYNEKKADKAFFKTRNKQIESAEDVIKFSEKTDDN